MVCGRECEDPQGAAGAFLDLEWCCDDDGTFRRQEVKIGEALQAVAAATVDVEVRRVGRIEMLRLPRIGAYRLGTKAMQVAFLDQPFDDVGARARCVSAVCSQAREIRRGLL